MPLKPQAHLFAQLQAALMREYLGERGTDRLGNQLFIDQLRDISSVSDPRREAVRELAHKYGLRPSKPTDTWWGYRFLEHLVSIEISSLQRSGRSLLSRQLWFAPLSQWSRRPESRMVSVPVSSFYDLASVKQDTDAEVEEVYREMQKQGEELGWVSDNRREPRKHIHWLYLRICPQPDIHRPWGWSLISKNIKSQRSEKVAVPHIQRTVIALAEELELALPRLPSGRIPNQF